MVGADSVLLFLVGYCWRCWTRVDIDGAPTIGLLANLLKRLLTGLCSCAVVELHSFPEMLPLMPLEMRFSFDGREYGSGYLRVPAGVEVDDPEDMPTSVQQGWRLVRVSKTALTHRATGWVPDNRVQARGLIAAGEAVERFMVKFEKERA